MFNLNKSYYPFLYLPIFSKILGKTWILVENKTFYVELGSQKNSCFGKSKSKERSPFSKIFVFFNFNKEKKNRTRNYYLINSARWRFELNGTASYIRNFIRSLLRVCEFSIGFGTKVISYKLKLPNLLQPKFTY